MAIKSVNLPLLGVAFVLCTNSLSFAQESLSPAAAMSKTNINVPAPAVPGAITPIKISSVTTPAESVQQAAVTSQVEDLKVSVLNLNRDLLILEEELLYPSSNQIAVYLSMDFGEFFNLDAVKLEIDDKLVASELYTDKQISALNRGGVQRLYIGNLKTGQHEISAFFTGRGPDEDYKRGAKLVVTKAQTPLVLELKIIDSSAQLQPTFEIKEWKAE